MATEFTPLPEAGKVEDGFFSVYNTMSFCLPDGQPVELSALLPAPCEMTKIIVAGHSLGSSIATMFSLMLVTQNPQLNDYHSLYTFASPATGEEAFANCCNATIKNSFRIWNEYDLVPRVLNKFYTQINGDGIEVKQSLEQMMELKPNPLCEHELLSYLWLLDPSQNALGSSCKFMDPAAMASRRKMLEAKFRKLENEVVTEIKKIF